MSPLQALLDILAPSAPTYASNDPVNNTDPDGRRTNFPGSENNCYAEGIGGTGGFHAAAWKKGVPTKYTYWAQVTCAPVHASPMDEMSLDTCIRTGNLTGQITGKNAACAIPPSVTVLANKIQSNTRPFRCRSSRSYVASLFFEGVNTHKQGNTIIETITTSEVGGTKMVAFGQPLTCANK